MTSTKVRCRNWAQEEKKLFATVLADANNRFAVLKDQPKKKQPTTKHLIMLKKNVDRERGKKDFKDKNEEGNFCNKNRDLQSHSALETSINKLRRKYTSLKAE